MIRLYILTACLSLASMTLPAQENDSPYAAFGDTTRTLDCRHADYARFDVPAILDDGTSATLVFDFPRGIAELKDEAGCVLSTDSLPEHQQAIFLSADPKATDYPHVSAYAYCMGNPVNAIDPMGLNPIFNSKGVYLGASEEGFTGMIYVYVGPENLLFNNHSIDYWTTNDEYKHYFKTYNQVETAYSGEALQRFVGNVMTELVSQADGVKIFEKKFTKNSLMGGSVSFSEKEGSHFSTIRKHGNLKTQIKAHGIKNDYEGTVENLLSSILIHEWYSHGEWGVGDYHKNSNGRPQPNHRIAYQNMMRDKVYYPKTTNSFRQFVLKSYNYYLNKER